MLHELGTAPPAFWNDGDRRVTVAAPGVQPHRHLRDLRAMIKQQGGAFDLEPWDWRYYAEKVRKARFDVDEAEVKPYLQLDNVIAAVSLSDKIWVVMIGVAIGILTMRFAAGIFSYQRLPVDAFPDVTPVLVQVFTETEGILSPTLIVMVFFLSWERCARMRQA